MVGGLQIVLSFLSIVLFPAFSLDESFSGLSYNGGKIMTKLVKVFLLWFDTSWHISGQVAIRNAITLLTSDWWRIVRQCSDSSNTPVTNRVEIGSECFYTRPQVNLIREQGLDIVRSVFNQSLIDSSGGGFTYDRAFEVNGSSIYLTLFSLMFVDGKNQAELMSSCIGNILLEVSAGVNVSLAWARAPQRIIDQCSIFLRGTSYLGPPNGNPRIDSVVGYALNDGDSLMVSSSCLSEVQQEQDGPPLFRDLKKNVSFNALGLNGSRYILQYIWDQNMKICALPRGYFSQGIAVNHTKGLQPYPPKQRCSWIISNPAAKFISFTVNYLCLTDNSDDYLQICSSGTSAGKCTFFFTSITFSSGDYVPFQSRGWELSYSAGKLSMASPWETGTPVSLNFTYINISKVLDFIAMYNATKQQVANFSGYYSRSDLPQINLNGEIMVAFSTQTDRGGDWLANFHIAAPLDNIIYREVSADGKSMAVKCFRDVTSGSDLEEEILLKSTSHPDIISLVGYANDGLHMVFEFMDRENLSVNLKGKGETLDWKKRLTIALAVQVCYAIQMLHMDSKSAIYHGNIASENILLDDSCNAKLGRFGAANYCRNGRMSPHHLPEMDEDIWSFGIVLIELPRGEFAEDREAFKNFTTLEEINELVGGQESFDPRLGIPTVRCEVIAPAKLCDVAKWYLCSGCRDQEAKPTP
ncbi:hypothetical protein K2173_016429 [Erythroxylum novogranatense]|uniref:Protein kinase domain-containing protein n=1 Tax=Erythroxylum novogranatense TaxID=1862640 RepID=A0AAV8SGX5_9ROSI|nr:hypothetical protein K2173_016429 [Erythroxylum novogranatense]